MTASDDDLLRPSLAADFDVRTFDRPWNPSYLPFVAFLMGPLGGGILYALNFRRLGQPRRARACMIGAVVLTLACAGLIVGLIDAGVLTTKDRIARYGVQGLSAGLGLVLTRLQSGRFRAWEQLGRPPRKLLGPAIGYGCLGALAFGVLLVLGLVLVGADVLERRSG